MTREKAVALIGDGLRNSLKNRGRHGDRALTELPEDDQRAALGELVDELEEGGFALYRVDAEEPG